jgi:hypothetical protein
MRIDNVILVVVAALFLFVVLPQPVPDPVHPCASQDGFTPLSEACGDFKTFMKVEGIKV